MQLTLQAFVSNSTTNDLFHKILITMWYLWKARNDTRFQRKPWTPWQVHQAVAAHIATQQAAEDMQDHATASQPTGRMGSSTTTTATCLTRRQHTTQRTTGMNLSYAGMVRADCHTEPSSSIIQIDRNTIQVPALLPGVRCFADASLLPDNPSRPSRTAGLGILFVNTQVHPAQTIYIYIKAFMTGAHSVIKAEAATLALAAIVSDKLNFGNTTFLSDCQQLVDFLNITDQSHPPDWRITYYTQIFANYSAR